MQSHLWRQKEMNYDIIRESATTGCSIYSVTQLWFILLLWFRLHENGQLQCTMGTIGSHVCTSLTGQAPLACETTLQWCISMGRFATIPGVSGCGYFINKIATLDQATPCRLRSDFYRTVSVKLYVQIPFPLTGSVEQWRL